MPVLQLSSTRNQLLFSPFVPFSCLAQMLSHGYPLLYSVSHHKPVQKGNTYFHPQVVLLVLLNQLFCGSALVLARTAL